MERNLVHFEITLISAEEKICPIFRLADIYVELVTDADAELKVLMIQETKDYAF